MSPSIKKKPEAAGCKITRDDTSTVVLTLTCSVSYGLYGSCYSALAASIPQLAPQLHISTSDFSYAYICRGVGYFLGTVLSSYILKFEHLPLSKTSMSCISLILVAITMFLIAFNTSYYAVLALFLIQGLGFGGVDMMANCAVPELWGLRAQPWMQLMHTMFGVGSIVGPIVVGNIGFRITFLIIGFCCLAPLGLLFLGTVADARRRSQSHKRLYSDCDSNGDTVIKLASVNKDEEACDNNGTVDNNSKQDLADRDELGTNSESKANEAGEEGTSSKESDKNARPLTFAVKYLTCLFYFLYMGYSTGYGAWVTVYALDADVTDSNKDAAYLTSVYWFAMTVGRLLAIFMAIYWSSTTMMRMKLVECLIAGIVLILISNRNYTCLVIATLVFGYADSSIFPLGMTILTDYGFKMDSGATTLFMIGTTMGEAVMPAVFGFCMQSFGPSALPWLVTACCIFLVAVYLCVDWMSKRAVVSPDLLNQSNHSVSGDIIEGKAQSKPGDKNREELSRPLNGEVKEEDDLVYTF